MTLKYPPPHSTVLRLVDNSSIFLLKGYIGSFIRFPSLSRFGLDSIFADLVRSAVVSGAFVGSGISRQSILDRY